MKILAFFVEGQTEQIFIKWLLIKIANQKNKNVSLKIKKFKGGGRKMPEIEESINEQLQFFIEPQNPFFEVLIYNCGQDVAVKSRILENINTLFEIGCTEIIGIQDLIPNYSLSELNQVKRGLKFISPDNLPLQIPFEIIIMVHETEAWFLAEVKHLNKFDSRLTNLYINTELGFDPFQDDMRLRVKPAKDLNDIYQLVGRGYSKKERQVNKIMELLDFHNLYSIIRHKIPELEELIQKIDSFLV